MKIQKEKETGFLRNKRQIYINKTFFYFHRYPSSSKKMKKNQLISLTEIFPALMLESAGCGLHSLTFCWYSVFLEKYRRAQLYFLYPARPPRLWVFVVYRHRFSNLFLPPFIESRDTALPSEQQKKGSNPSIIATSTFQEKWNDNIILTKLYLLFVLFFVFFCSRRLL